MTDNHAPAKAGEPQMPRGVAMMIKNILGIDPAEVMRNLEQTFVLIKGFCQHADARIGAMAQELSALREQINRLETALNASGAAASPGLVRLTDAAGSVKLNGASHGDDGTTGTGVVGPSGPHAGVE